MYAFVGKKSDEALVLLRVENSSKAVEVLTKGGIQVLSSDKVYKL